MSFVGSSKNVWWSKRRRDGGGVLGQGLIEGSVGMAVLVVVINLQVAKEVKA